MKQNIGNVGFLDLTKATKESIQNIEKNWECRNGYI